MISVKKRVLPALLFLIIAVATGRDVFIVETAHATYPEAIAVMVELNHFDTNNVAGDNENKLLWRQGDAATTGNGELRVAPSLRDRKGTVVRRNQIRLQDGFSTYFVIKLHTHRILPGRTEPPGADGLAFIVYEADQPKIGSYGSGIGYAGIDNSIIVEFDTWRNDTDPDNHHVAIMLNGDRRHTNQPPGSLVSYPAIRTDLIHAWVDYHDGSIVATIGTGSVRSDDANETITRDVGDFLEDKDVFIGFSASTGSAYSHHDLLKWYFKDSYVEGGLKSTQGTYSQAASTIDIELDNVINPDTATINLRDAVGNIMKNENVDIYINAIKQNGFFNTGDDGVLNYSFSDDIKDGEHVLRVIANGGTSNFKNFIIGESTPKEYFTFNSTTGTITGYRNDGPKDVVIPSTIDGIPVTNIGAWAFHYKQLTSVHIPEGVTSIGDYAFYYNQLASVYIPESVTSITFGAFAYNQLTSVIMPEGVTSIGDYAFYYNQLTSVSIPEGVTSIGSYGFASNKLTNVTILNRQLNFGSSVFIWNQGGLEIYGFDPSTAKDYAQANGHTFINLDSPNQYTVIFKDYDGSLLKTEVVDHGEGATPPSSPTREGYSFTGWDKAFDNITTDLEVIAQYDINQYSVTFNALGGSEVETQKVNYNSTIIEAESPTREGYIFVGWYKDENLTNPWDFNSDKVKENTILYARWLSNESNIMLATPNNVKIDENFSEIFTLSIENNTVTERVYASDLSLSGAFSGLSIGEVNNSDHTVTASVYGSLRNTGIGTITLNPNKLTIGISPLSADVTVNSLPIPSYIVTFRDYDGGVLKTQIVDHGEAATAPGNPTREGYSFTGWDKAFSNITANLEVIPQYDINQYTVIFKDYDGSILKAQVVDHGEAATAPGSPTRIGYRFERWDMDFTAVTSDSIITAVYSRNHSSDSSSDIDSASNSDSNIQPIPQETGASIIVNGQKAIAGTEVLNEINGEKIVEFKVNANLLNQRMDEILKENKSTDTVGENLLEIPITFTDVNEIQSILTGDIVEKMEQNDFSISIITEDVNYIIPAKEIGIQQIASILNVKSENLKAIEVNIEIRKSSKIEAEEILEKGKSQGYEVLTLPLEFRVVAKTTTNTGEAGEVIVSKFSSYVSRVLEIPTGIAPEKITTGIVYNQDGTFSHIPTMIFSKDGRWYAKLNSFTNSSYAVIRNSITVSTVENHWSKEHVNDMAARLVIKNPEIFTPDEPITRGEFAEYITKALGIYRTSIILTNKFIDVEENHELATAITIATDYGIITGYPDNTFKPDAQISREEAMTMYGKAMDVIDLIEISNNKIEDYTDKDQIAEWAYPHVLKTVSSGVFRGRTEETIDPKGTFTHAEAVTAIRNLLRAADLIND